MSDIRTVGPITSGVAVGGNGVATSTGATAEPISGVIVDIYIKYLDSPPAGTTVTTVRAKGTSPRMPTRNFLVRTNIATDGSYIPKEAVYDAAGAVIIGQYMSPLVDDIVEVVIAGANAGDSVLVWLTML
jgi:hypothetical protein